MEPLEAQLLRQTERSRDFFWHRLRWDVVRDYLPEDRPFDLIDVGAGAGLLGRFLERDRPLGTYRFIEPILSLNRFLEGAYGKDRNAKSLEVFEGIEYVTLLDVLEHQRNDRGFLRALVDRMEAGSRLFVTVPAFAWLWSGWDVALGHYRRYDRRTLAERWRGLPVRVIELNYLFPELIPAAMLRRLRRGVVRHASETAFPDPPRALNEALYQLGRVTLRFRSWWPGGTSVFAALEKRP
jgi:hypothetical protein